MHHALSESEMKQSMDDKVNICTYTDLHNFSDIKQLLGPYNRCFLLFLSKENYGHWTCLFLNKQNGKDTLHFFNSYGDLNKGKYDGYPDEFLKYIDKNFRAESHQDFPYLTELMLKTKYPLEYNPTQFQKLDKDIKTCGYWCICRLMFSELTDEQFTDFIRSNCANMQLTPDELVVKIVDIK